ncbi:DJ-1/PfpI family protein [Streptomyces caniscabiei]|uniref:DJ-1/PfpI family protein n=1 Tax=Streptomyces caniscabiei TaxID=2746961 RepID=UPI000A39BFBB|nr:DJ-1/PfpI family protein [Streptomyces caniscabiei]
MTHPTTRRNVLRGTVAAAALAATAAGPTGVAQAAPDGTTLADAKGRSGPTIGILIFDGYSMLDPTGPAEVLSRIPDATVMMIAEQRGPVRTDTGDVALIAERSLAEVGHLDVLLVSGGGYRGMDAALENQSILNLIRESHRHTRWTTSVCSGGLLLAAAGLLKGRKAAVHWLAAEQLQKRFGVTYSPQRYVHSGKIITSAGVSAGVDMSLYLASLIAGEDTARAIQLAIEYDPQPPFDSGNAAEASEELKRRAAELLSASEV